jgi:hypothetical protein
MLPRFAQADTAHIRGTGGAARDFGDVPEQLLLIRNDLRALKSANLDESAPFVPMGKESN